MSEPVQAQVAAVLHKQLTADEQREIVKRVAQELRQMQRPSAYSFGYTDLRVSYGNVEDIR